MHAVKAALLTRLELEEGPIIAIQKVKSGLAIILTDQIYAGKILSRADTISFVLSVRAEEAENWFSHMTDHVARSLRGLDGSKWEMDN